MPARSETSLVGDTSAAAPALSVVVPVCNEEANVGNIVIRAAGYEVTAEGVFTYRVNDEGKIVALRAYWELDKATESARKV